MSWINLNPLNFNPKYPEIRIKQLTPMLPILIGYRRNLLNAETSFCGNACISRIKNMQIIRSSSMLEFRCRVSKHSI